MEEDAVNEQPAEPASNPKTDDHINGWRGFATLGQFLKDDGWYPEQLGEKTIFRVFFSGDNGDLRCYAQVRVDLEQFIFYVVAPVKAPAPVRSQVAEYLTRANYGLRIGNFELDYSDGEVRYKSSLDFEQATLTAQLIRNAMYPAVHTADMYLQGLLSVMYGNKTPAEAIEEAES